ncbi:hypothetical protein H2200_009105 [Cladophialophora chaetospira]|uniref:DUF3835 domain-containing protein n=1 Tax=Cladophialophora chaetospira TaxID=386627 RepID=A0AA39CFA9_9EURO|nr:hypothetical protein H2200_009105 [Cladophialophora chaetospira]
MDDAALARIERQRKELETNIAKLRKALRHWQTLEIDYEGLREEFLGIPQDSNPEECLKAAKDSKPELLDENELRQLLVDTTSRPRRPAQLVDLLSKRVDYVTRNIETIRKQVSDAEKKRNALLLAEEPDHRDEASLPLAEILEELDDSGNIISSKVQNPGSDAPQLLETLKKAGVEDLEETDGTITKTPSLNNAVDNDDSDSEKEVEAAATPQPQSGAQTTLSRDTSTSTGQFPTNSADNPEEAELRREMLAYSRGLDEVGAIVAELELEEGDSEVSYDEDQLDGLDSDLDIAEDSEDDSEDENGKSRLGLSVSRGYQKKMEELQERLGLKNIGPEQETEATIHQVRKEQQPPAAEAARKAAIARDETSKKSNLKTAILEPPNSVQATEKKSRKKKVAFSSELDIASEEPLTTTSAPKNRSTLATEKPNGRPINESIVERESNSDATEPPAPTAPVPQAAKQSRFKAARQSQPQTPMFARPMEFPPEKTNNENSPPRPLVAADLVERTAAKATKAPDPNDFSDQDHQREIVREYEQHRIKRILAQEGRFLGDAEEGEITPLEDEDTGQRVSRFKAARLKR